jgi:hypothetical protein
MTLMLATVGRGVASFHDKIQFDNPLVTFPTSMFNLCFQCNALKNVMPYVKYLRNETLVYIIENKIYIKQQVLLLYV